MPKKQSPVIIFLLVSFVLTAIFSVVLIGSLIDIRKLKSEGLVQKQLFGEVSTIKNYNDLTLIKLDNGKYFEYCQEVSPRIGDKVEIEFFKIIDEFISSKSHPAYILPRVLKINSNDACIKPKISLDEAVKKRTDANYSLLKLWVVIEVFILVVILISVCIAKIFKIKDHY